MKKVYVFMIDVTFIFMMLSACRGSKNENNASPPMYQVSEATGLYSALEIDAEQIAVLPAGTILLATDGDKELWCDTFTDNGLRYSLCKVKVYETGQTGWVLKMFIEKN